ncbi:MAG: hypothetical protein QW506_03090 [Thermoproteota archaeon]
MHILRVGCRLNYLVEKGEIIRVEPVKDDDVSEGFPCLQAVDKGN